MTFRSKEEEYRKRWRPLDSRSNYLYIYTDGSRYEFPLCVGGATEVAAVAGITPTQVINLANKSVKRGSVRSRFYRVPREEDDE